MKVEVSIGEAIDKLSILELKRKFIEDSEKRAQIEKEINALEECNQYKNNYYDILNYVNENIWHLTNKVKSMSFSENPVEFSSIVNEIFEFNQKRFRIKNMFNLAQNSFIREQKSYGNKTARIILSSPSQIYNKIAEIMSLTIEYDILFIECSTDRYSAEKLLKKIYYFAFNSGIISMVDSTMTTASHETSSIIDLSSFCLSQDLQSIFVLEPITYRTCGQLGDYIHELSVVNEVFLETGRKGIIYFSDSGHPFRNGIESTFNDTYEVIIKQPYVKEYKIHNNENYEVCLADWRNNLSQDSWNDIFKRTYGIDWGRNIWLDIQYDEKWKNTIIINHNSYRPSAYMTIEDAFLLENYAKYNNIKLIFLTYDENEFHAFKNRFNVLTLEHFHPSSFLDMCIAIRSCHFFIGCLSAPLTIAHACRIPCMILLSGNCDDYRVIHMKKIWDSVYFNMMDIIYVMNS